MPKAKVIPPFNVWIAPLTPKRKACAQCGKPYDTQNQPISVGEYIHGKFRNAFYACGYCLIHTLKQRIRTARPYTIVHRSGHSMPWYAGKQD